MRYRVVLADPPWTFNTNQGRNPPPYQLMPTGSVAHLLLDTGLGRVIQRDAFLFLWVPNSLLLDGYAAGVIRSWGFEAKQIIPWVKMSNGKIQIGCGAYTRVCTETLILCRRGKARVRDRGVPGVILAPRGLHSAKPDASYLLIERLCEGPYLEIFARRAFSPTWMTWGNQAPHGMWTVPETSKA